MMRSFLENEDGATLVEYGIAMLFVISLGVSALIALGSQTGTNIKAACDELQNVRVVSGNC